MTVEEALSIYGEEHGVTVRAPATIGYSIMALRPILGPLPVATINKEQCRRYARDRGVKPGTVRRELGVLQAALNHCHAQGYLLTPVKVTLSPPPSPRDRCLTRDEAAKLLRAAWRNPKSKHLARFILTAIHTGTRSGAILNLRFMAHTQGVYVDTESGMMYRRGAGQAETKKRQLQSQSRVPCWHICGVGKERRTLGCRDRRPTGCQRQDCLGAGLEGSRYRSLHPPRLPTPVNNMGDAAGHGSLPDFSEFQWMSWNGPMPNTALTTCVTRP